MLEISAALKVFLVVIFVGVVLFSYLNYKEKKEIKEMENRRKKRIQDYFNSVERYLEDHSNIENTWHFDEKGTCPTDILRSYCMSSRCDLELEIRENYFVVIEIEYDYHEMENGSSDGCREFILKKESWDVY